MSDSVQHLVAFERLLQSYHPARVLERGYAIVRDASGAPRSSVKQISPHDALTIQLRDGHVAATANSCEHTS